MERERRLVFGEDAQLYDDARPSYPDALANDLVGFAGQGARVVDIGSGTGKALRLLARHGCTGVAVEPHPSMAAVARRRLPPPAADGTGAGWRVDVADFERWVPEDGDVPVDLVTCAQAWHWLDPAVRMHKAHDLLRPGGWLALWWNVSSEDNDTPVDQALAAAYALHAPEVDGLPRIGGGRASDWAGTPPGLGFGLPVEREYPWTQAYTTAEWLDLLRTHSNHRLLDPEHLERLLTAVADALDDHGGVYHHRYVCQLWAIQRRA
jgi:SAM-dependent methyltransferase